jgi:LPXTG-motif cell wall-anchored protein
LSQSHSNKTAVNSGSSSWLYWVLGLLALLALWFFFAKRRKDEEEEESEISTEETASAI